MNDIDEEDDPFFKILNRIFGGLDYGGYKYSERNGYSNGFVDIFEDEDYLYITAEIKVRDEDLEVKPEEDRLIVEIMSSGKWTRRNIGLPYIVIPESAKITFNRGVLDVKLKRRKDDSDSYISSRKRNKAKTTDE